MFTALNNIVECNTLNGPIELTLPADTGINVDGISKTGTITSEITGVTVATKPGNKQVVTGVIGRNRSRTCASPPSTEMCGCGRHKRIVP